MKKTYRFIAVFLTAMMFIINSVAMFADETEDVFLGADTRISEDERSAGYELSYEEKSTYDSSEDDDDWFPGWDDDVEEEDGLLVNIDGSYNGGAIVRISGEYEKTSADDILKRINQIRKEACDKGYPNPYGTGNLSSADYVPVRWSASLEAIAKYRAVEASCTMAHMRTNGKDLESLYPKKLRLNYTVENVAFPNDGLMQGIEQCYAEKQNYLDFYKKGQTNGEKGHYLNIIMPDFKYIGAGSFKPTGDSYYASVYQFTTADDLDEAKDKSYGETSVDIECSSKYIDKVTLTDKKKTMKKGETYEFPAKVTIPACISRHTRYTIFGTKVCKVVKGLAVTSSDENVIKAESSILTAVGAGKCTVTAGVGNKAVSREITVTAPLESERVINDVALRLKVNKVTSDIMISTSYDNATTATGKAIKAEALNAHTDIGELLSMYDVDLSDAISVTYKAANNKKAFINITTHKNQPYFYPVLKLSTNKAKAAGIKKKKQIESLKKMIASANKKLKAKKCYFYINPTQGS